MLELQRWKLATAGERVQQGLTDVNLRRYHANMGTRAVEQGPIGRAVAANVRVVRERRQVSQQALSVRLADLGRPILSTGIAKIEAGDRRVDVDDLLALAAALNVSPALLLLPDGGEDDPVAVTERLTRPAWSVWMWVEGLYALPLENGEVDPDADMALHDLRPTWKRRERDHPLSAAVRRVAGDITNVLRNTRRPDKKPNTLARWIDVTRADLRQVDAELQRVQVEEEDRG